MSDQTLDEIVATLPTELKETLALGRVGKALGSDPKFRRRYLEMIKDASPETPIPELDLERNFDARVGERVKPYEDTTTALRAEVDALKSRLSRDDLRTQHNLTEEDWTEVQALKEKGGIVNDETAIEHHRMRMALSAPRPTIEPTAAQYQQKLRKINPRKVNDLKTAALEEGSRIVREMRGRRYA